MLTEIEIPLSPAGQAALHRMMVAKRENGSPTAPHFALRRRMHRPTPFEEQQELAAAFREHKRRPVSRAELNQRTKDAIHVARGQRLIEEHTQSKLKKLRALASAAKAEWLAFNGQATQEQLNAWTIKYEKIYIPGAAAMKPVNVVSQIQEQSALSPILSIVPAAPQPDLLKSSGEFVNSFVQPDYLIDGIIQRRYFYSVTAQTGVGKTAIAMRLAGHVATGRPLGDTAVEQGDVLYLAGENPSDVQARWLGLTRDMCIVPSTAPVHFLPGAMDLNQVAERITAEVARKGLRLSLVVVDTAAAYNFNSEDENSNAQAGAYARQLRSLTTLPGGPAVLVLCHPTKRAGDDDLIPRGGGAFLAEVDGNIAVQKRDSLLVATAQGKFRGSQAWELRFELETMRDHPTLRDTRGRAIPTVVAKPVGAGTAAALEKRSDQDDEIVLRAVSDKPGSNPTDLARAIGWTYGAKSEPNRTKAERVLKRLQKEKLVIERLGGWRSTPAGDKELNTLDLSRPIPPSPS